MTKLKHGHSKRDPRDPSKRIHSGEYRSWRSMMNRCRHHDEYKSKGIVVVERWRKFENFLADMGPRPEGMSLDRMNGQIGYQPGNCRWATRHEQNMNRCFCRVHSRIPERTVW